VSYFGRKGEEKKLLGKKTTRGRTQVRGGESDFTACPTWARARRGKVKEPTKKENKGRRRKREVEEMGGHLGDTGHTGE